MSNPVNISSVVTLIFIYDWFNLHDDILVLTRVFCLFITLGSDLSFQLIEDLFWRTKTKIWYTITIIIFASCCLLHYFIVLLYMYNSDKCCINNDQSIVNNFMNCLFDYYILSFRCKILCCFLSFISLSSSFLIYPNNHMPFWMVWNRRVYLIVGFKLSKKAGRYSWYQSFGLAITLALWGLTLYK